MSDADIIGIRIMQGISKGIADLNNIVQIKNAAEEGERKRIEWERKEAEQNREVDWRTEPSYMNSPDDIKSMIDKHYINGGYSKDGKTITVRAQGEANKAMSQNKEMMTHVYEAGIRETNAQISKVFAKKIEELEKGPMKEDRAAWFDNTIKSLRVRASTLKGDLDKTMDAFEANELLKAKTHAEIGNAKAQAEKAKAEAAGMPSLNKLREAQAGYYGRMPKEGGAGDKSKEINEHNKKLMQTDLFQKATGAVALVNKLFLEQLQNPKLGESQRTKIWNDYVNAVEEEIAPYEKTASIWGLSRSDIFPTKILDHKQFGIQPSGKALPTGASSATAIPTGVYSAPGTTPATPDKAVNISGEFTGSPLAAEIQRGISVSGAANLDPTTTPY